MLKSALLLLAASLAMASSSMEDMEQELMYEDEFSFSDTFRTALGPRAAAPNVCNGGSVSLRLRRDPAPCRLRAGKKNEDFIILSSPRNNTGWCHLVFYSDAPGFVRTKLAKANLSAENKLVYIGAFGDQYEFTNADVGKLFIAPTTFGRIYYDGKGSPAARAREEKDFQLTALPKSNRCQRVINAPLGTGGRLIFPGFDRRNYTAGTMCQWWIRAPEGMRIKIKFNSFNVGTNVTHCIGSDYIGIDKAGDPTYTTSPVKHCGDTLPEDIISNNNAINILGYGLQGGRGFCCTYEVFEPLR